VAVQISVQIGFPNPNCLAGQPQKRKPPFHPPISNCSRLKPADIFGSGVVVENLPVSIRWQRCCTINAFVFFIHVQFEKLAELPMRFQDCCEVKITAFSAMSKSCRKAVEKLTMPNKYKGKIFFRKCQKTAKRRTGLVRRLAVVDFGSG
jgi:hypothetical protein